MNNFFMKHEEQSFIKTTLVKKYFTAWARIMNRKSKSDRLGYVDLFCGPGTYQDGTISTPIEMLKIILENQDFSDKFVVFLNDKNQAYIDNLKNEISLLQNIEDLKHKPILRCSEVDPSLCKKFAGISLIPSFVFIDPWGYKGVTKDLIQALTEDWGCDCVLFFNYNRINPAMSNIKVKDHMKNLFGEERYNVLNEKLQINNEIPREDIIINEFAETMKECGIKFILPFRFISSKKDITSHYLIFLTKNKTGYKIMKDIMAKHSSSNENEIGSFQYMPPHSQQLSFLSQFEYSLSHLKQELLEKYVGKTLTVEGIFESHNVGTPYVLKNYQTVLLELEKERKIIAYKPNRKKGFMAKDVKILFK